MPECVFAVWRLNSASAAMLARAPFSPAAGAKAAGSKPLKPSGLTPRAAATPRGAQELVVWLASYKGLGPGGELEVGVEASAMADPASLVAACARVIAHAHRLAHNLQVSDAYDPRIDVGAVYLGFGLLTADAALRFTSRTATGAGGHRRTRRLGRSTGVIGSVFSVVGDVLSAEAMYNSAIRFAIVLAFAAVGEWVAERAGTLNISVQAMMIGGAYTAAVTSTHTDVVLLSLAAGVVAGVEHQGDGLTQ